MLCGFEITYYNSDDGDDYFMNIFDKIFNNLMHINKSQTWTEIENVNVVRNT